MTPTAAERARDAVRRHDWPGAAAIFREMALADPVEARHWSNLGIAEMRNDAPGEGRLAFMRAIIAQPGEARGVRNLAATLSPLDTPAPLTVMLRRLHCLDPLDAEARITHASLAFRQKDWSQARSQSRRALLLAPADHEAAYFLGYVLCQTGVYDAGGHWLSRVLITDPEDHLGAARELALTGAHPAEAAMSPSFVADWFDHYVEVGFETHLTRTLSYVGPRELTRLLAAHFGDAAPWADRAVDIGCGTGLAGAALRDHCRTLTGVDLSPRMIEEARARGIYDDLAVDEAVAWLAREASADHDLAIATDVTSYIGNLGPLFVAAAGRLRHGGTLAITVVEDQNPDRPGGWGLARNGTFVHHPRYVEDTARAAGFVIRRQSRGAMRRESRQPLPTLYYVLQKSGEPARLSAATASP